MKKYLMMVLVVAGVLSVLGLSESQAKGGYGTDVDYYCLDSNPYNGDCKLCHTNDTKVMTTQMREYNSGNLCYFCSGDSACSSGPVCLDADGDGFAATEGCGTLVDCNDNNRRMNPGNVEDCFDSIDNDCNGDIDGQDIACSVVDCTDGDGDGFSVEGEPCGLVDCNDGDPDIYPGAEDICNDGIDQDCSGRDRTKGKACKTTTSETRPEGKGKTCSDGIDNDNDGFTDCDDRGCDGNRKCSGY